MHYFRRDSEMKSCTLFANAISVFLVDPVFHLLLFIQLLDCLIDETICSWKVISGDYILWNTLGKCPSAAMPKWLKSGGKTRADPKLLWIYVCACANCHSASPVSPSFGLFARLYEASVHFPCSCKCFAIRDGRYCTWKSVMLSNKLKALAISLSYYILWKRALFEVSWFRRYRFLALLHKLFSFLHCLGNPLM